MRPITLHKTPVALSLTALLLFPGINSTTLQGQETGTKMPSDPTELMLLVAKVNGLDRADIQPWHLKATFQWMGEDGTVKDEGTIEEFWAGPKKNRVTYTTTGVSQTFYQTEQGRFRSGPETGVPAFAVEALNAVVSPLPRLEDLQHEKFQKQDHEAGSTKLICLHGSNTLPTASYCIEADKPVLRITSFGPSQTVNNKMAAFQGQHVPLEVAITLLGKTQLKAQVDSLESLKTVVDSEFIPPQGAVPAPCQQAISAAVAQGQLIKKVPPQYPMLAMRARISGMVVLEILIDKQGHVRDPQVVSGPDPLRRPALDAIKQWLYRPYLLNGEPVDVKTIVNVVFSLGG